MLLSAEKPYTEDSRWGTTMSYTYTDAEQNRDINEHYVFDAASISQFPFLVSNAASKHRFVATGSFGAPWGLMVAGKFTWSSPMPRNVISCYLAPTVTPDGAPCAPVGYDIGGTGYQSLDVQLTKNFEVENFAAFYLRMDVINVFNDRNFVDYTDIAGSSGLTATGRYNTNGNITGLSRTLRASFGVSSSGMVASREGTSGAWPHQRCSRGDDISKELPCSE